MKSERRHELETNQLADSLAHIPIFLRQYGSRIFLGLTFLLLVIALIYNRSQSKQMEARVALDQLSAAREGIQRLTAFEPMAQSIPAAERANRFRDLVKLTRENLDGAVRSFDEPAQLAEVLVARGDLNWAIAGYPELPATDDAPATPTAEERTKALEEARTAYQRVLDNYPQMHMAALSAHLGLAAIAENTGSWDEARRHYQAVADNEAFAQVFRDQAKQRLDTLDEVRKPVLLVEPRETAVLPTSADAPTQPTTTPADGTAADAAITAPAADGAAADGPEAASPAADSPAPATQPQAAPAAQ